MRDNITGLCKINHVWHTAYMFFSSNEVVLSRASKLIGYFFQTLSTPPAQALWGCKNCISSYHHWFMVHLAKISGRISVNLHKTWNFAWNSSFNKIKFRLPPCSCSIKGTSFFADLHDNFLQHNACYSLQGALLKRSVFWGHLNAALAICIRFGYVQV